MSHRDSKSDPLVTVVNTLKAEYQHLVGDEKYQLKQQSSRLDKFFDHYKDDKKSIQVGLRRLREASISGYGDGSEAALGCVVKNMAADKADLIGIISTEFEVVRQSYEKTIAEADGDKVLAPYLVQYRVEGFEQGFKEAAEALLQKRFESPGSESAPPAAEIERLSVGIDELVREYKEKINAEGFLFRGETEKLDHYRSALIACKLPDAAADEKVRELKSSVLVEAVNAFKTGAKAALEIVLQHWGVDKTALLTILAGQFETLKPFYAKQLEIEEAAKMKAYRDSKEAEDKDGEAAFGTQLLFLFGYQLDIYDEGFKAAAEVLLSQKYQSVGVVHHADKARADYEQGLSILVAEYKERIEQKAFKFRYESQKLKEYKETLLRHLGEEGVAKLQEQIDEHKGAIVRASLEAYKTGTEAAVDCLLSNLDLVDKATLVDNINVAFQTLHPLYTKELQSQMEAKVQQVRAELCTTLSGEPLEAAIAAKAAKPLHNLYIYQSEAYAIGFKDAAEYLVAQRFRAAAGEVQVGPTVEDKDRPEHRALSAGFNTVLREYEEAVGSASFKFRGQEHKLKQYEEALKRAADPPELVKEKVDTHREDIKRASLRSYAGGGRVALQCIVSNFDLDKASLLANLDVAYQTNRPSFQKELQKEVNTQIEEFKKMAASPVASLEAVQVSANNLLHFQLGAYDQGFKDATEFLIAQWIKMTQGDVEEEKGSPSRRGHAERRLVQANARVARLEERVAELEAETNELRRLLQQKDAEIAKLKQPSASGRKSPIR